jgi:hypothetical protein
VTLWLATGQPPLERCHGWVEAEVTMGVDRIAFAALVERYGAAVRRACAVAGFAPAFDMPIAKQSRLAQAAAKDWIATTLASGHY